MARISPTLLAFLRVSHIMTQHQYDIPSYWICYNIKYRGISTWLLYTGLSTWTNTIHYRSTYFHTCIFNSLFATASPTNRPCTLPRVYHPWSYPTPIPLAQIQSRCQTLCLNLGSGYAPLHLDVHLSQFRVCVAVAGLFQHPPMASPGSSPSSGCYELLLRSPIAVRSKAHEPTSNRKRIHLGCLRKAVPHSRIGAC